jgi:putative PEP-CTERM system TPR-repeat lipoprotein
MKRNSNYEAGFIRARADEEEYPEEQARLAAKKRLWRRVGLASGSLLVLAVIVASVVYIRQDTPAKQLAKARAYSEQGRHVSAIIELKRSLEGNPAQPEARFLLGGEMMEQGDMRNAEIELRKAMDGGLAPAQVLPRLVRSVLYQQKFNDVVSLVSNASIDVPEANAELQTMLGTAYFALGRPDAARDALDVAREMVPNYSGASIAKAEYLISQQDYQGAQALLSSIPDTDKEQAKLQALKGDIARALNKPADAVAAYQASLKRHPGDIVVRISLAQTYIDLGDLDHAQTVVQGLVKDAPINPIGHFLAALIAYERKDYPTAHEAITRSVQLVPTNIRTQLLAGAIAREIGDPLEAEAHLRAAIEIDPHNLESRILLARSYMDRREAAAAADVLTRAQQDAPTNQEVIALAAQAALALGNRATAAKIFDQVGVLQTADVNANLSAASLRFAAGNASAGFAQLAAAAKAAPSNTDIDVALVLSHLQVNQIDAARADWNRLHDREPNNARTYNVLAAIDRARGDPVAARRSMEKAVALDPHYYLAISDLAVLDIREHKIDDARARLKKYVDSTPQPTEALLLLSKIEELAGTPPATVQALLDKAHSADPRSEAVYEQMIGFRVRHNDLAGALATADDGLKIAPNNQQMLMSAGDIAMRLGKVDRAVALFSRLSALGKENPDYFVRLGMAQLALKLNEDALTSFRQGVKVAPQRFDVQVYTVESLIGANRIDEARRLLFDVTQASPNSPVVAEMDADIKLAAKQYPDAIAGYRAALSAHPSADLAVKTGTALLLSKNRGAAKQFASDWLAQHPKDSGMWVFDAQIASSAKDYDRALSDYRKALDGRPNDPLILNNLAWLLDRHGDAQALVYAEKAHALAPDDANLSDTLGWMLVQQGSLKRGVQLLESASASAPQQVDIKLHLAKAQLKDGRNRDAKITLQALQLAAPDSDEAKESKALLSTL